MRNLLDFLRLDDLPRRSRPSYRVELRHMLLWGIFAGLVDGNTSSIVAAKTFGGSELLVAFVWASPLLAHLLSLGWSILARGRPRVRMYRWLAIGAAASVASIVLTPANGGVWAGWLFAAQVALARIFVSGIVNVRTAIWQANYPQTHRAHAAGKLQTLSFTSLLITSATIGALFDHDPNWYRWVYPSIALVGLASLWPLRRLRIRGERRALAQAALPARAGAAPQGGLLAGLSESWSILRSDRRYARYCSAQYLLGSASFMVDPVLTAIVTTQLQFGYLASSVLLDHLPIALQLATIRIWARYFDRVGVLKFRVLNSAVWIGAAGFVFFGMLLHGWGAATLLVVAMLAISRVCKGIAIGGGAIAWNLGHLQFAPAHQAELYMGIHVALTGLRGMIMPFVGTAAYALLGAPAFGLAACMSAGAMLLFRRLAADVHEQPPISEAIGETEAVD